MEKSIRWNRKLGYVVPEANEKDFQHYDHHAQLDLVDIGVSPTAVLCGFKLFAIVVILTLPLAIDSLFWIYRVTHHINGETGPIGITGPVGLVGALGFTGSPGPTGPTGFPGLPRDDVGTGSSSFIRWGRLECSNTSELVYTGMVAGGRDNLKGGTSSYLCLPETPEHDFIETGVQETTRPFIEGVIYRTAGLNGTIGLMDMHKVPCAVCRVSQRGVTAVHPARSSCLGSWTLEYNGYLMGSKAKQNHGSHTVCVDGEAEPRNPASSPYALGVHGVRFGSLYPIQNDCSKGQMPCPPYLNGREFSCAVCSI